MKEFLKRFYDNFLKYRKRKKQDKEIKRKRREDFEKLQKLQGNGTSRSLLVLVEMGHALRKRAKILAASDAIFPKCEFDFVRLAGDYGKKSISGFQFSTETKI